MGASAALDFSRDAALFTVVYCCGVGLLQPHRSRYPLRTTWPLAALLVAGAAVYVLARLVAQ